MMQRTVPWTNLLNWSTWIVLWLIVNQILETNTIYKGKKKVKLKLEDSERASIPPLLTNVNLHSHEIIEDFAEAPYQYQIQASDLTGRMLYYRKRQPDARFGRWTIEKNTGLVKYWPFPDFHGKERLHFTVHRRYRRDTTAAALYTNGTMTIKVVPINDEPVTFFSVNGINVATGNKTIIVKNEQNYVSSVYSDFTAIIGAYDVDKDDSHAIVVVKHPKHGTVTFSELIVAKLTQKPTCPLLTSSYSIGNHAEIPCNLKLSYDKERYSWFFKKLTYKPNYGFYGNDSFQVIVRDGSNTPDISKALSVIVAVLKNPCQNNAVCAGSCDSLLRTRGFDKYGFSCQCALGFEGKYCETNINDCTPNPCEAPFICIDDINSYRCQCPKELKVCKSMFPRWQMALITSAVGLLVASITVVIILLAKRRMESGAYSIGMHQMFPIDHLSSNNINNVIDCGRRRATASELESAE